jgi:hypothetical protein
MQAKILLPILAKDCSDSPTALPLFAGTPK